MTTDEWAARQVAEAEVRAAHSLGLAKEAFDDPSWCSILTLDIELQWDFALGGDGRVVRKVRGRKMRTWADLYDEFAAVWQFGDYFGENGRAFNECLCDLDWLPTHTGYVVVITDPEQVLADATDDLGRPNPHLPGLVDILENAVHIYAEPIEEGNPRDRPAVGFKVILAAKPEHADRVRHVWRTAGVPLEA